MLYLHVLVGSELAVEFRVIINAKKMQCVRFGLINDTGCNPVTLNKSILVWEHHMSHPNNIVNPRLEKGHDL